MSDMICALCLAVEATHSADDILHLVPGAALVCGFPKLCQPPVHLNGYHAHAGEHAERLLVDQKPAHSVSSLWG